jgi:hypothetical protein
MSMTEIINEIPDGVDLETYFEGLDIFDKRKLISELEIIERNYSKRYRRNSSLVCFSLVISLLSMCFIDSFWLKCYLIIIHIPMVVLLNKNSSKAKLYRSAIILLERKLV